MKASSSRPVVALLTDFGLGDGYIGIMKGVIAGITPDAQMIDITHEIAPQHIGEAAWILASTYRYFPAMTAFLCVVDPGVGSDRGAIALHAGDWFFVGPDNGLFSYILNEPALHGAVELANPAYRLSQVSSTFHGRDIFAPAAAYLASGAGDVFSKLGPSLDPANLVRLSTVTATWHGSAIEAHIVHIDRFGNLITGIPLSMVPDLFTAEQACITFPEQGMRVEQRRRFFAEGAENGQAFIYGDSSGYVGIAVRNGNAAKTLGVACGVPITFDISPG
jgi:S-adenosylmethionine hydrolase